jgi:hypothetical protein
MGHDHLVQKIIHSRLESSVDKTNHYLSEDLTFSFSQKVKGILNMLLNFHPFKHNKIRVVLQEDKNRLFILPLVIPIILYFEILLVIGNILTYINPNFLLRLYSMVEQRNDLPNLSLNT